MDSIFACFYLTGQLKLILQKFQLAGVVLVVSNPHDFNLTGQLESKPPEFPTLAVTLLTFFSLGYQDILIHCMYIRDYLIVRILIEFLRKWRFQNLDFSAVSCNL